MGRRVDVCEEDAVFPAVALVEGERGGYECPCACEMERASSDDSALPLPFPTTSEPRCVSLFPVRSDVEGGCSEIVSSARENAEVEALADELPRTLAPTPTLTLEGGGGDRDISCSCNSS